MSCQFRGHLTFAAINLEGPGRAFCVWRQDQAAAGWFIVLSWKTNLLLIGGGGGGGGSLGMTSSFLPLIDAMEFKAF
jgi:hypothetical protein